MLRFVLAMPQTIQDALGLGSISKACKSTILPSDSAIICKISRANKHILGIHGTGWPKKPVFALVFPDYIVRTVRMIRHHQHHHQSCDKLVLVVPA
jgi:hypothetical protein